MMREIVCGTAIAFLVLFAGNASAEEEKGDTQITASLKAWMNEWKHYDPAGPRRVSDNAVVLAGPAVEVEFKNRLVLEGSYLMSASDYKFTEAGVTAEFDRRDLDLGIGRLFNDYVGFFVGYRNSSFKEETTGAEDSSYGIFYSLRGTMPFIGTSSLYGNLTYLNTRLKAEGLAREDAPGWITEIGGKMVFTEHLAMKLGYKWETAKGKTTGVKDSFRGTALELTYAF